MAEANVKKEEKTMEVDEMKFRKKMKSIGGAVGAGVLVGVGLVGIGLVGYSIGEHHGYNRGTVEAYTEVYKLFPEIQEKLMKLNPAFFESIKHIS